MTRAATWTAVVLAAALAPSCASLPPPTPFKSEGGPRPVRSLDLLVGPRRFTASDDWPDIDKPLSLGLEFSWRRPDQSLAWELALIDAREDDEPTPTSRVEGRATELSGGLRYEFPPIGAGFRPYVGGGVAVLNAVRKDTAFGQPNVEVEDWDAGLYAHGGIRADLTDMIHLGVDVRVLSEEWISAGDFDLDYVQVAFTIGSVF